MCATILKQKFLPLSRKAVKLKPVGGILFFSLSAKLSIIVLEWQLRNQLECVCVCVCVWVWVWFERTIDWIKASIKILCKSMWIPFNPSLPLFNVSNPSKGYQTFWHLWIWMFWIQIVAAFFNISHAFLVSLFHTKAIFYISLLLSSSLSRFFPFYFGCLFTILSGVGRVSLFSYFKNIFENFFLFTLN
jgi:hypothetical protein